MLVCVWEAVELCTCKVQTCKPFECIWVVLDEAVWGNI